jgi:hypothetical protein
MQEAPKWLARPISTTLHAGLGFPPRSRGDLGGDSILAMRLVSRARD